MIKGPKCGGGWQTKITNKKYYTLKSFNNLMSSQDTSNKHSDDKRRPLGDWG